MKKVMKRIMCFLLCTALIVAGSGLSIPVSVYADTSSEVTIVDSGMCGDNVTSWILGNMTMNSHHRSLKALDFTDILPFILDLCLVMFYNDYINMTR